MKTEDHYGRHLIDFDPLGGLDMIFTPIAIPSIVAVKFFWLAEKLKTVAYVRRRGLCFHLLNLAIVLNFFGFSSWMLLKAKEFRENHVRFFNFDDSVDKSNFK